MVVVTVLLPLPRTVTSPVAEHVMVSDAVRALAGAGALVVGAGSGAFVVGAGAGAGTFVVGAGAGFLVRGA
ncbi:MAG: hypothetical protein Q4G35_11225 [Propionibacteriaceae bacterium]|nr:hypothetical protein [Propionibacteriaceae bacterium]